MEFKGSKTEANLHTAFAGESEARNKYTYYAGIAKKEGYNQIASIFEETAGNEKEHAKIWFKILMSGGIPHASLPDTMANLKDAAAGEHYEWTDMYAGFAKEAREEGFDNINMDIIVGLPQETKEDVENTLEEIKKLGPDNLTVHSLAIKRAARLNTQKEEYAGMKSVNSESTMELTQDAAEEMGMKPYYLYRQKNMTGNMENVGYAKPGKEGIYNILIMEEMQTIVALGAGAITKAVYPNGRIERCENVKDIKTYLEKTDEMIERKKRLFADEKRSD